MRKNAPLLLGIVFALVVFGASYSLLGGAELFNSSDRFKVWSYMMAKWAHPQNILFGTGIGTYHVFSINLQHAGNLAPGSYWSRMHNEWLQFVFETGIVGSLAFVSTYVLAIHAAIKDRLYDLAFALFLFGIYMGANSALHHAPPAIFGAWLLICALRIEPLHPFQRKP